MSIKGRYKYCLRDSKGNIKRTGEGHNTVTNLGKLSFLYGGLGDLFNNTAIKGNKYQTVNDLGTQGTYVSKSSGQNAKNMLLHMGSGSLAGKTVFTPSTSQLIGFASTNPAASAVGEGSRVKTVDPISGKQIVTTKTQVAASYEYGAAITGEIDTVAMTIPAAMLSHDLPSGLAVAATTKPLPPGSCGLDESHIGLYNSGDSAYNKQLAKSNNALSDFIMSGTAPNYLNTATYTPHFFEWSDYIIGLIYEPYPGYDQMQVHLYAMYVYNKNTQQSAVTQVGSTVYNATKSGVFCVIHNNELYITSYTNTTAYKVTISGTTPSFTASALVQSDIIGSDKISSYDIVNPISIGGEINYIVTHYVSANNYKYYFFIDPLDGNGKVDSDIVTSKPGSVYLNTLFVPTINAVFDTFGNLFSYFTLDEPITKAQGDVLTITYYYELEESA